MSKPRPPGIAAAIRRAKKREREQCAACIPTSWLDPLLTGPNKVAEFSDGPAIEKLLRAVRDRILQRPLSSTD